ncbi:thiol peroxidase [Trichococcus sp. K1Tr]|uniref:thiol peroxidase n=1 Tax=Trichococcus sp. K1Tr TaxID=3020847 RepID=UPI0023315291|nr:thiol peroxidase [Trichococcus sp. K1Tr]MDB6352480.1 thiol peroxidase [Trichococcus sp. K1Tr]
MQVTLKGEIIEVLGTQPVVGEKAPAFSLYNTKDEKVSLDDLRGSVVLISVFPDINTRVCDNQTRKFNETAANIEGVTLLSVSRNTKEELADWCSANGIDMQMLHDDNGEFAEAYGLKVPQMGNKLARSVFVIDKEGVLTYMEIVPEISTEPDEAAALAAAKNLL